METYQLLYNKLKRIVYNIISPHILKFINEYKNSKFVISPINSKAFELLVDNNTFLNMYDFMPFHKLELGLYYHNPNLFTIDDVYDIIKSIVIDGSYLIPLFFNINIHEPDLYTIDMLKEDSVYYSNSFNLSDITTIKQSDKYYKVILVHENINIVLFKISKKIHKYDCIKFIELVDNLTCINYLELLSHLQSDADKNKKLIDILLSDSTGELGSRRQSTDDDSRRSSVQSVQTPIILISRNSFKNSHRDAIVSFTDPVRLPVSGLSVFDSDSDRVAIPADSDRVAIPADSDRVAIPADSEPQPATPLTQPETAIVVSAVGRVHIPISPMLLTSNASLENLFDNTTINTNLLINNCTVDMNLDELSNDSVYDIDSIYNYNIIKLSLFDSFTHILNNSILRDLLYYYSCEGYKPINSYLLGNVKSESEQIPNIINHIVENIQNREVTLTDSSFIVWRYTFPSLYGNLLLTDYNEYDIIKFSSFVSTTYQNPNDHMMKTFSSYFTPMAIFKIIVTPTPSNYKKFIFIESISKYPYEREVLFIPNTMFRIINKRYFTFHIKNNKYVQKIVFTLEIVNENNSSSFYSKQRNVKVINLPDLKGIKSFYF
jgi:hypothetical protein